MNFYTLEGKWSDGTPHKVALNLDKVDEIICEKNNDSKNSYDVRIFFNSDGNSDKFTMERNEVEQLAEKIGLSPFELFTE